MTSSESESEEDEEEMLDELDSLVGPPSHSSGQRSLRRSSRLTNSGSSSKNGLMRHFKKGLSGGTDRNNNLNSNGTKNGMPKRRSILKPEHFFSFLDTTFWHKYMSSFIICDPVLNTCFTERKCVAASSSKDQTMK